MLNSVPSGDKSNTFSPFPPSEYISKIDMENDLKKHHMRSLLSLQPLVVPWILTKKGTENTTTSGKIKKKISHSQFNESD